MKKWYTYEGPIRYFDEIVAENWYGRTYAVSEKQAKSNLAYQYKREHGLIASTKITLTGEVKEDWTWAK